MNTTEAEKLLDAIFGTGALRNSFNPPVKQKPQSGYWGYNEPSKKTLIQNEMSPLERDLDIEYAKPGLEALYDTYAAVLVRQHQNYSPFYKNYYALPEKTQRQKLSLVRLFATMFRDETILQQLLDAMPKRAVALVQELVYEGIPQYADEIAHRYGVGGVPRLRNTGYTTDKRTLPAELGLCAVKNADYVSDYSMGGKTGYRYTLSVPLEVRACLRRVLPVPAAYTIQPLESKPETLYTYSAEENVATMLPLMLSYLAETPVAYSANGKKILKTSVKNFRTIAQTTEFFPEPDRDTDALATTLLMSVVSPIRHLVRMDNSEEILRQMLQEYGKTLNISMLLQLMTHLKSNAPHYNLPPEKFAAKAQWVNLFAELPSGGVWVAVNNLGAIARSRLEELAPVPLPFAESYLHTESKDKYDYTVKRFIRPSFYNDAVMMPLLKAHCFLFAALGLVELAFDAPSNAVATSSDKAYLTLYDGARAVRLTALGEYAFGKTDVYKPKGEAAALNQGRIELDEERMIATLYGNDTIRKLFLEKFMQVLPGASGTQTFRFKMDYTTFLQGCTTLEDVKAKIALFRQRIHSKPPRVWEEFFTGVQAKVEPVEPADYYVLRIKPSAELAHLLTHDAMLRDIVLRAEGYHILVRPEDMTTLRKRLQSYGYLMPK
jgi:hypothetical protein